VTQKSHPAVGHAPGVAAYWLCAARFELPKEPCMSTSQIQKPESFLSKRRLGVAGVAAVVGCAACCAIPLLAAAGLGSGAAASLSSVFRPGSELLVGGAAFALVLAVLAVRSRLKRSAMDGCGPSCMADGSCCERGSARSA
jgi:hypothetical protein